MLDNRLTRGTFISIIPDLTGMKRFWKSVTLASVGSLDGGQGREKLSAFQPSDSSRDFDRWLINNAGRLDHYTSPCVQNHHVKQRFLRFTNVPTYIPDCTYGRRPTGEERQRDLIRYMVVPERISSLHTARKLCLILAKLSST